MTDSQIQSDEKIKKLQGQVQDVTDVMEKNIERGKTLIISFLHRKSAVIR